MVWRRADSKPLPGSVVIPVNGAYMLSRIDWVDYFTVLGKYIDAEKNGTVLAHEGYLHPHSWKWAIPTRQVGSGRGTGWPWFVKSPMWGLKVPGPAMQSFNITCNMCLA